MTRLALAAVLSLLPLTATAAQPLADGTRIRPEDVARLEALDRATGAALRQALGQGSAVAEGPKGPARDEIAALADEVMSHAGGAGARTVRAG